MTYAFDKRRHPLLSRADERELLLEYAKTKDTKIRDRIIAANMRFVMTVAQRVSGYGLPFEDLVQEGAIGLLIALEKFDPSRNVRFLTFGVWYIRAYMQKYVYRMLHQVNRLTTIEARLAFHKDSSDLLGKRDVSLNNLVGDGPSEYQDLLESETDIEAALIAMDEDERLWRHAIDATANDREREILSRRILNHEPASLRELGEDFGLSRERVRQIESTILKRLQKNLAA